MTSRLALLRRRVHRYVEVAVWGGERRERFLMNQLRRHYDSVFRRAWVLSDAAPHYFDHRIDSFSFASGTWHPFVYYRGFFAAELVREGDTLLDIGCGDGFFARRFFAPKCVHVDGIDVDEGAIDHASRFNTAPNIEYSVANAVTEPFPRERYDVIVLDGALGHFAFDEARVLLAKIRMALSDDGAFVGSESLGQEGDDHLQFFEKLADLARVLEEQFEHVQLRKMRYALPSGFYRHEAFWRCSSTRSRLDEASWQDYAGAAGLSTGR